MHGEWVVRVECTVATIMKEDLDLDKWQLVDESCLCYKLLKETVDIASPCSSLKQGRMVAKTEMARLARLDLQAKPSDAGARSTMR